MSEPCAVLLGFGLVLVVICYMRRKSVCDARQNSYCQVHDRLNAYVHMKSACATLYHPPSDSIRFVPTGMLLSSEQHNILLGILKKIEAKNAVAVAVIVFALPGIWSVGRAFECSCDLALIGARVCFGAVFALLPFGILGAAHLGQRHYERHIKQRNCQAIRSRELQRCLTHDMLKKEISFDAAVCVAFLVGGFLGVAYLMCGN